MARAYRCAHASFSCGQILAVFFVLFVASGGVSDLQFALTALTTKVTHWTCLGDQLVNK